jgi:AraC family transcriptional regulator of adaptative response / DNA-3-methyladenine glycosylase II
VRRRSRDGSSSGSASASRRRTSSSGICSRLRALARGDVAAIGLPPLRGEAIRALARLDPDALEDENALVAIKGIGPWTASYVAMRAARDPDAMPVMDLALRKAMGLETAREIEARAERWRPWRAYAVMHLWQKEKEKER